MLVGNKCDLEDKREVTTADAQANADKWTHGKYIEASAKTMTNVDKLFQEVVREILNYRPNLGKRAAKPRSCILF